MLNEMKSPSGRKLKILGILAVLLLGLSALTGQLYAKDGADDPAGDDSGSSNSSSNSQSRESEQRGQEPEQRGQEPEARGREAEGEAPKGNDGSVSSENEIEFELENELEDEIKIEGSNFEIKGKVQSVSGNTFVIAGKIITIDPSKVINFQQVIPLAVNEEIEIEGIFDENDVMFAREIRPLAEDNGQDTVNLETDDKSGKGNDDISVEKNDDKGSRSGNDNFLGRIFSFFRSLFSR